MVDDRDPGCPSRRAMLAGAGAAGLTALLTGCQTYGEAAAPAPEATGAAGGAAKPLATVADIPVGGGRIFAAQGVVVTQPAEGTIKAFSAKCTHQGCTVTAVRDRTIVCACHNSVFDIADGSVRGGPAGQPLPEAAVSVEGNSIRLA
ncbi:Rieske (2Fe-2S) protein [Micromonospora purpureochromogenes]|uniref:Rieske (2Fe-2S) protein n=1 Tax=Micromonospora purpureochromogenes TaxID=47872 RepID=UPI0033CF7A28